MTRPFRPGRPGQVQRLPPKDQPPAVRNPLRCPCVVMNRVPTAPRQCRVCQRSMRQYLTKGRCHACAEFFRRNGAERGTVPSRIGQNLRGPRKVKLWGEQHPQWKGDAATTTSKRGRAQRRYALGKCELCDRPATDRHHKDRDTGNNSPENIQRLCRRCHMTVDGRLEATRILGKRPRQPQPPKPCINCRRPYKPLRRGLCSACRCYRDEQGVPRPASLFGGVEWRAAQKGGPT